MLLEDFARSFRDIKLRDFLAGSEVIALPIISIVQMMVHLRLKGIYRLAPICTPTPRYSSIAPDWKD